MDKDCDSELEKKLKFFLDKIDEWRYVSKLSQIHELIWKILFTTGMYEYYGALSNGAQRQKNLMLIFDKARQFENTSLAGLYRFITYIERLKSIGSEAGEAKILSENSNVVRYMSMHKSKGLEFPIVIIYGAGTSFNLRDINNDIYLDDDGVVFKFLDERRRIKLKTIFNKRAEEKYRKKILSEEMRTLYVAMTRAKEKLIITGKVKNFSKKYNEFITEEKTNKDVLIKNSDLILAKNSYLEWILMSLSRHEDFKKFNKKFFDSSGDEIPNLEYIVDDSRWDIEVVGKEVNTDVFGENINKKINYYAGNNDESVNSNAFKNDENIDDDKKKDDFENEKLEITDVIRLMELNRSREPWSYPYENLVNKPTSISVTEIKKIFEERNLFFDSEIEIGYEKLEKKEIEDIRDLKKPSFMRGDKTYLDAAKRGTIIHHLMQIIDLNEVDSLEKVEKQIDSFYRKKILSHEAMSVVDSKKVFAFFESRIGKRALKSDYIGREREVLDNVDLSKLYPEIGNVTGEFSMMRGIVDMFFEEDKELVIVDYKTDMMKGKTLKSIKQKYKVQLDLYAKALEKITGKKVKEKWIFLYEISKELKID